MAELVRVDADRVRVARPLEDLVAMLLDLGGVLGIDGAEQLGRLAGEAHEVIGVGRLATACVTRGATEQRAMRERAPLRRADATER